jgi:signal transduction histidine kinase
MLALLALTLGICLVFSLFAMAFAYTVEDRFLERQLDQEAQRLQSAQRASGQWPAPSAPQYRLLLRASELPDDLAEQLAREPRRREFSGREGRHYHLQKLDGAWLLAEVSEWLVVRPQRQGMLGWLALWALGATLLALGLAALLARRMARPLERLAQGLRRGHPERLPQGLAEGLGQDEIGTLARNLDALHARTQAFIEREQAFTRDVSHELRTPLAVLRLGLAGALDAAQRRRLQTALEQAEQTLDCLLCLAREAAQPAGHPSTLILPLIEQWALDHEEVLGERLLRIELPRDTRLPLPEPVLRLVLGNLLGNALAHGEGEIAVSLQIDGTLAISNPGPPPPAGLGQAFVKGEGSAGFGLGLSLVQRLLARHGAELGLAHTQGHMEVSLRPKAGSWGGAFSAP